VTATACPASAWASTMREARPGCDPKGRGREEREQRRKGKQKSREDSEEQGEVGDRGFKEIRGRGWKIQEPSEVSELQSLPTPDGSNDNPLEAGE
jgi:hypothetical protein